MQEKIYADFTEEEARTAIAFFKAQIQWNIEIAEDNDDEDGTDEVRDNCKKATFAIEIAEDDLKSGLFQLD